MIALHNFSGDPASVSVRVPDVAAGDVLVDLLVDAMRSSSG